MKGEYKMVPFLGINTEPLNDQSQDGLCSKIINLKPKGVDEQPYWVPFEIVKNLSNGTLDFNYSHGIESIAGAFWQIRNFVGDFQDSESTSLKRLVILCDKPERKAIDIVDPIDWSIAKSYTLEDGSYTMTFTRINEISVINLVRNGEPYKIYYLIDDLIVEQGWPEMPRISYKSTTATYTEDEVLAGQNGGIPRKDSKQYFMVRWSFRLFDNSYVKHSRTEIIEVPTGLGTNSIIPEFTMEGYDSSLPNRLFWESFISGVSVFCTQPKATEKEALDDFLFYEVGFFPFIDKKPMDEWDTPTNPNIIRITSNFIVWITQQTLGIDNFTHHRFSANVVDSYNNRVLLGGVSTDFAKPCFSSPQGVIDYVDGEAYTSYFTFDSGSLDIDVDYYLNDGTPTDSMSAEYENQFTVTEAFFDPLSGREFKEVSIKEIAFVPTPGQTPDGRLLPTHQYLPEISAGKLKLRTVVNESTFNGVFVDPFMVVEIKIGDIGGEVDQILLVTVTPSGVNASPYFDFGTKIQTVFPENFNVFHEVTIKTQSGTFKRVCAEDVLTGQRLLFPNIIHYPDRRAISYRVIAKNGDNYELVFDKKLTQHPNLNLSYVRLFPQEMQYFIGGVVTSTTAPDQSVNLVNQWDKNRAQASISGQPLIFEASASYRVGNRERDSIQAFGVNTIDISQGQFGQYPLYVFSDKSVWALEQAGDPNIAFGRIVPIDTFNGLNNPYAICNAENIVIAVDKNYIYSLSGLNIQRIDRPISNDPEYASFLTGVRVAYHKERDYEEIVFSNPSFGYSWLYNMRYRVWYKWDNSFRLFFQDQPVIYGIDRDNRVLDFSEKDTNQSVQWELETRKMNLGSRFLSKRLHNSQVRAVLKQPDNPQCIYDELFIEVDFEKDDNGPFVGIEYDRREVVSKDLWLKTKYGSFQSLVLKMSGKHQNNGSYIHLLELNYENRYTNRVRR
jgi:hypothetical protein